MITIQGQVYLTAKEISEKTGIPVQTLIKRKTLIRGVRKMLKEYLFLEEEVIKAFIKTV
jgi:endonuclease V-like protein UPF0215 family